MTLNIHHGKGIDGRTSLQRIANEMERSGADVIALQEVDRFLPRSGFCDQPNWLAHHLGMNVCFSPSVDLGLLQYGNAILSRYPIIAIHVQYLRGWIERRSILVADLLIDGEIISVINTHLGTFEHERKKQLPLLLRTLDDLKHPAILTGDFNVSFMPLFREGQQQWREIQIANKAAFPKDQAISDPVFVNFKLDQGLAVVQPSITSDHYPQITDISWSPTWPFSHHHEQES